MNETSNLVLPKAALRSLAGALDPGSNRGQFLELSIRVRDLDLSARDFSLYLSFLDGVYGRLDPAGFRSYVQQQDRRLSIARVRHGSTILDFVFDLLRQEEVWRGLMLYIIAKAVPTIIRGEAAKNWAEAAQAGVSAYADYKALQTKTSRHELLSPTRLLPDEAPEQGLVHQHYALPVHLTKEQERWLSRDESPPKFKLTKKQRKQLKEFMSEEPSFQKLNERHRTQLIRMAEDVLAQEQGRLPAAVRFSRECVVDVSLAIREKQG
jgi:hypothetical protein